MRISDWSSDVCSSDLLGLKDGENPNVKIRYEEINKVINKKSIAAIDNNPLAKKILRFIQFLNPDLIQIELLRKRFSSEERRVGKECVSTCRSRRSQYH